MAEMLDKEECQPVPCSNEVATPGCENKIRQIQITELNRGYLVNVGCHNFAISTKKELLTHLLDYINEPAKTEEKWYSGKLF